MSNAIAGLKPEPVWRYFAEISAIPRGSGNEEAVARFVEETAGKLGLESERDASLNVVVRKPASPGRENASPVCLQGHLDMVCEKNSDVEHDFEKDPIKLVRKGDFIAAEGTTLGADNGAAVAACLAVMEDKSLAHGPLELLFTADEETGLTGAKSLDAGFVKSRTLINLDSEDEDELCYGCAGGADTVGRWTLSLEEPPAGAAPARLKVMGLTGGHSGLDIDKGRGNSIKLLGRTLEALEPKGARLALIRGGNKRNAIPREAEALIYLPGSAIEEAAVLSAECGEKFKAELKDSDPGIRVVLDAAPGDAAKVMSPASQEAVLGAILDVPNGVVRMSADDKGLVETSTNLGVVRTEDGVVEIETCQRSSVARRLEELGGAVSAFFKESGAEVARPPGYPGWEPDIKSPILAKVRKTYERLFGKSPLVKTFHAGLECGLFAEKWPGMDMVSFGPTIRSVHSPDEKMLISSIGRFWKLLTTVLEEPR